MEVTFQNQRRKKNLKNRFIKKISMLLVDSDIQHQKFMADILSQKASSDFAKDGSQALKKIVQKEYDLIVTEIDLPDNKTFDLIQKTKLEYPHAVIIVLCNEQSFLKAMESIRWGATDIIVKPLSIEQIVVIVEKFFSIVEEQQKDFFLHSLTEKKFGRYVLPSLVEVVNQFLKEIVVVLKRLPQMNTKNLLSLRLAIYEMLFNALEHGNLEISYEKKQSLLQSKENYFDYLEKRCQQLPFKNRKIFFEYNYEKPVLTIFIQDEGKGFDSKKFLKNSHTKKNPFVQNGRGILISQLSLDELSYNKTGNQVIFKKVLNK